MSEAKIKNHAAEFPGSARASRVLSGASPESSVGMRYSKRRLPHFERPWAKYAVAFSTYQRRTLTSEILHGIKSSTAHRINKLRGTTGPIWDKESFDRLIRSESDLEEKFSYICRNPWVSNAADQNEDYRWLWTQEMSSARAPKTARGARALPKQ